VAAAVIRCRTSRPRGAAARVAGVALAAALAAGVAQAQASAPAASPEEAAVARDMGEETQRIAVTVKDMFGREEVRQIPVTVFRPRGDGPFPLVIMNHGRAVEGRRAQQGRQRFEDLSRYLVGKGFVVLLPTRVGYAETYSEFDPEATGPCNARRLGPMADAVYAQVLATLAFAKTLPFVDASRWIVAGQSVGGLTAVVTVGHAPPGLIAGINFAGGSGGDPENRPQQPCSPQAVERLWSELAPTARAPMLWLYWQNDQYWGPEIPKQWHVAWRAGGAKVEFHSLAPAGKDGHAGSSVDMDHWVPIVDEFLAGLGFAKTAPVARPPSTAFAALDQVDKVPVSAANREVAYRRFLEAPLPRAFAVGPRGAWSWSSGDWALGKALGRCGRSGNPCRLYAVDNDVVWTP
jgi:dienelactone hydrolase